MRKNRERGAVAVEFAIILPVLLLLIMGIIEFGRVYNTQISLTHAAREGVRVMAISNNPATARAATINAATSIKPALTNADIAVTPTLCSTGAKATVTISYTLSSMTGFAGPFPMQGRGVMLCGG
jgi:Flp pilus assembly protein TadG